MMAAAPIGPQKYTEGYKTTKESVPRSRHDVEMILHTWGLSSLVEAASMVITELMTNAVLHCPGEEIRVAVLRSAPDEVHITVKDSCPVPIAAQQAAPADESGRGLFLVEAYSSSWGSELVNGGKQVWARLKPPQDSYV